MELRLSSRESIGLDTTRPQAGEENNPACHHPDEGMPPDGERRAHADTAYADRRRARRSAAQTSAQTRYLSHALQSLRETERRRIARELHDDLAQSLAALRMDLATLRRTSGEPVSFDQRFSDFDRLLESAIQSVRRIATELHPTALSEGGLYFALRSLLRNFSRETGIGCEFIAEERELILEESVSTAVFRIAQEALVNAGRHAKAGQVIVMLRKEGGNLSLRIHDDGRGIAESDLGKENCYGLLDMQERVRHLQGAMEIVSGPTGGTIIAVTVPLRRKNAAKASRRNAAQSRGAMRNQ